MMKSADNNPDRVPEFVISLDFELLWGVRDHADRDSYGRNVLGARAAIPRLLEIFERYGISATWATVGFLFCESRDELMATLPPEHLRPVYASARLSNYSYLPEVGEDEAADPYYFAPSLIRRIAQTPGQEIGTHTLSHFYCLEGEPNEAAFAADLGAAVALAKRRSVTLRSIVFPRNQYGLPHLEVCRQYGLAAYRGNPSAWAYRPAKGARQTLVRRGLRLLDAHSAILGHQAYTPEDGPLRNVPASRFLRPCAGKLAGIHPLHLRTVMTGMTRAAQAGQGFHLWWHPHNFGIDTGENLNGLRRLLDHFKRLQGEHGMVSRSMAPNLA